MIPNKDLKLAALYSGGKDSTFAIYQAKKEGHDVVCLVTIFPLSDESQFLHYPNVSMTRLQAQSMKLPQLSSYVISNDTKMEISELEFLLVQAKQVFGIEGIVHGGILSEFQKNHFESVCKKLNLKIISPLWGMDQKQYMKKLIQLNFRYIITSVSSDGLDNSWLGREITDRDIENLEKLSIKYGFNLSFEGGEAESLVLNCPLFLMPLKIIKSNKTWDGYRGRFEITEAILE
ncbi:MAG TPA: diphthine--ammonia ligase [Nitrosopumilaceae archaeon]|nr:diphthine--ammonia ligase [Nitrosopumilaceae archaeon]